MSARTSYRPWTEEEKDYVRAQRAEGVSAKRIAHALGRSIASVQSFLCYTDVPLGKSPDTPLPEAPRAAPPIDPIQATQDRRERLLGLRREREELEAIAGERSLRATLEAVVRDVARTVPPGPRYQPSKPAKDRVQEVAHIQFSDWHFDANVSSERVRGFNVYNREVAEASVSSVVQNARAVLGRMRRGGYEFPRAIIAANGDFVEGTIHELEKHADGHSIVQSVVRCGYVLASAVRDIAADFDRVDVFCTVGNHGRMGDQKRLDQKAPSRNWDALVYFFAQCALRDVPNVTVTIPDAYAVGYDVLGWRFLQQHGHEIKSWNGIPWYGIERYVSRITAMEASRNTAPHYYVFGHFHTSTSLPTATGEMFVNGSIVGATEYGVNGLGKADRPSQWLLGVHREQGVTHRWPIYPDPKIRALGAA